LIIKKFIEFLPQNLMCFQKTDFDLLCHGCKNIKVIVDISDYYDK